MSTSLPLSQPLMLRPDVVATVLENGATLLDLETKFFYSVNAGGWLIVQRFEIGASPASVLAASRAWGAGAADEAGITAFMTALQAENLIAPEDATDTDLKLEPIGPWESPALEKHKEPLQRLLTSAFDPTMPLAE